MHEFGLEPKFVHFLAMPRRSLGDVLAPELQDNVDDDRGSEQWGDSIQRDDATLSRYDTEEVAKEGGDGTH